MNQYKLKVFLVVLMGVFVSCQDNGFYESEHSYGTINLQAEIVQENISRANDNGFADGDRIGIFVVDYNGDTSSDLQATGNHADNILFSYNIKDGSWTGSTQLYWKDNATPIDLYGYYPFDGALDEVSAYSFAVERNQRDEQTEGTMKGYTGYEVSDFLWSKKEKIAPTEATITLHYNHLLAGIKVSLIAGDGFEEAEWNRLSKTVLVENTRLGAFVNLGNGNVVVNENSSVTTIIPQVYNNDYRAIVVPQTVEAGKRLLSITVDGYSYEFKRDASMTYQGGKLHKFTIQVSKKKAGGDYEFKLVSEAITPWENDPLSHNGTAREYITVHVEEGEYMGDIISNMKLDPKEILNLKLIGTIAGHEPDNFKYIRENMPYLEAINLKDLRTKRQPINEVWSEYKEMEHGYWTFEDDFLPRSAFENMAYLSYVVWPDSLKGISRAAFAGTNLRGSLILPEGLKYIGMDCFYAYNHQPTALSGELYIPSTVDYIGDAAFAECYFNSELVLPHKMKYLGNAAFKNCRNLTGRIQIPEGLTEVNAAWLYTGVTGYAVVPQGVKKVNGIGCLISGIYLPEGVEVLGPLSDGDFPLFSTKYGESGVNQFMKHDILLPSTLKTLNEGALASVNSAHVSIPEGMEIISANAFNGAKLQDTLTIPNSVIQIRSGAFAGCKYLTAVVLPEKLMGIEANAFNGCHSLNYIRCMNPEPPALDGSAFNGVEKNNFTLVVPEGSEYAYRNAEGWKEFKRISTYYNFVCRPMFAKLLNRSNTRTVILNADGNWEVTYSPSWAHVSKENGYKKTELQITIDELTSGAEDRSDSIVFTLTDKKDSDGNPITTYYKITQFDSEWKENGQHTLQKATKGNGVDLIFTGDGYDAENIAKGAFESDMKEGIEYFFGIEPYKTYREYFNVHVDVAMSYESGVCTDVNIWRDTKFNTRYGGSCDGRLAVEPESVFDFVLNEVKGTVTSENISRSLVVCVLNSDVYEGKAAMYSDGSAVAFVPHSRAESPNDYRGLIHHEAGGHGFGKLADEYSYHRDHITKCFCYCCDHMDGFLAGKKLGWYANLSASGKYSDIEWKHLIFDSRYDDIVDIYEGGYYHSRGIFRSEYNSCMSFNISYYSTISRQAIVERILDYAGEEFDFETFVSKDSREMGYESFAARNGVDNGIRNVMHSSAPLIKMGSPMEYIRERKNKLSK